jgi:hypothetical protein
LRKLPGEYVTNYDRMLDKLIAKYGRPNEFLRRGQVIIETLEGDSSDVADRKFSIWLVPRDRQRISHRLQGEVVLSLDPTTGEGTVLYSTPLLGVRLRPRELRLQGRPPLQDAHASK